jgi:hypothetical protein
VAISFLLHKLPFVQGITSSRELGAAVSQAILEELEQRQSDQLQLVENA